MKKILIIISMLIICGCSTNNKLEQIIKQNNYIIVDVRTKSEYNTGHVVNSINIPYDEITKSKLDKNKTILVYCKSGNRSNIAFKTLKNMGYEVYDLGAYDTITLEKE